KAIVFIGGNFRYVLVVSSLLVLWPVFYVAKRHSVNPMLTIFLFFAFYIYLQSFNITCQAISVSIILMSYVFLLEGRKKLFCLCILLATSFHLTALLCLPLLFVNRLPNNTWFYLTSLAFSLIVGIVFSGPLLNFSATLMGYDRYLDDFESNTQV